MERTSHWIRDYGLTVALVVASLLVFWNTTMPQIRRNLKLDRAYVDLRRKNRQAIEEIQRLEKMHEAAADPLVLERKAREYFGDLVLPRGEILLQPTDGEPILQRRPTPARSLTSPREVR